MFDIPWIKTQENKRQDAEKRESRCKKTNVNRQRKQNNK